MAVVHQRISQLGPDGILIINSTHTFNRHGRFAFGCIEELDLMNYCNNVGVINGKRKTTLKVSVSGGRYQPESECVPAYIM